MRLAENALTKEIWPRPSVTRMLGNLISNCLLQRQFRDGGMVALLAGGVEKTQGGRYTSLLGATIPWRMTARKMSNSSMRLDGTLDRIGFDSCSKNTNTNAMAREI